MSFKKNIFSIVLVFILTFFLSSQVEANTDIKSGISVYNENLSVKLLETSHSSGHSFYINSNRRYGKKTHTYFSFGLRYYLEDHHRNSPFISGEFHSFDNDWFYRIGGGYRFDNMTFEAGMRNYGTSKIYLGFSFDYSWQNNTSGHIKIDKVFTD